MTAPGDEHGDALPAVANHELHPALGDASPLGSGFEPDPSGVGPRGEGVEGGHPHPADEVVVQRGLVVGGGSPFDGDLDLVELVGGDPIGPNVHPHRIGVSPTPEGQRQHGSEANRD